LIWKVGARFHPPSTLPRQISQLLAKSGETRLRSTVLAYLMRESVCEHEVSHGRGKNLRKGGH
jgi:hypothetical protein